MYRGFILTSTCLALAFTASAQRDSRDRDRDRDRDVRAVSDVIPSGTRIPVRVDQAIDVRVPSDGRVFTGTVVEDINSQSGTLMIPKGARAELIVQNIPGDEATVDLESLTYNGRRYMVDADKYDLSRKSGVGTNERTAKYVGGGAVFGTILGAIAGGGKGAAIGALAGGAAGGGAQTLTRGKSVNLPAESVITFKLDEPLRMAVDPYVNDNGYDENGSHYHNNYYRRDRSR